jgi:hypothetical protein
MTVFRRDFLKLASTGVAGVRGWQVLHAALKQQTAGPSRVCYYATHRYFPLMEGAIRLTILGLMFCEVGADAAHCKRDRILTPRVMPI